MRSYAWTLMFVAVVFAVGWSTRLLADRVMDPLPSTVPPSTRCASCGSQISRCQQIGPHLTTIECLAEELLLDAEQSRQLRNLVADTSQAILDYERAVDSLVRRTRVQVDELLTDDQRARLDCVMEEKWREFQERRLAADMDWIRPHVATDVLGELEIILRQFENKRGDYYRALNECKRDWPDRDTLAEELRFHRERCDEQLRPYLHEELRELFWKQRGNVPAHR